MSKPDLLVKWLLASQRHNTLVRASTEEATSVGGVPSVIRGCGLIAPPGDVHELATAVVTLLCNPALGARLGRRGYERVHRKYTLSRCLGAYDRLIRELAGTAAA